jgi:AcrR family transcriptional regulator
VGSGAASRRQEIVAIAASVFARKGLAGATVRDIADAAGILSGSLYHHFASKEEMIAEVLGADLEEVSAAFAEAVVDDPATSLRNLIGVGVAQVHRDPDVARILRNDGRSLAGNPRLAHLAEARVAGREVWDRVVVAGCESGVFRPDVDPALVVRVMLDAVLGTYVWFLPAAPTAPGVVAGQLADLFLAGLQPRPA